jgi:hypothetical protein
MVIAHSTLAVEKIIGKFRVESREISHGRS